MRIRISFLCLFLGIVGYTQEYSFYTFPQSLPSVYQVNFSAEKNNVLEQSFPKVSKRTIENFAENNANLKYELLTSGFTYVNWTKQEAYVNKVLQELKPLTKNAINSKAYIVRDPQVNAFAIFDGSLFFNVGYLATMHSEAGLYFVVAHELAHVIHGDLQANFIRRHAKRKKIKTKEEYYDFSLKNANYSRQQETKADSLACVLISKLGYQIKDFVPDFYSLLASEEKYKNSLDKKKFLSQVRKDGKTKVEQVIQDMSSHPEIEYRIKKILAWAEKLDAQNSPRQDSPLFIETRNSFVYEQLAMYLKYDMLKECTERSFIHYLQNPKDAYFEYFLLESLRKQMYIDSLFAKKTFISYNYPSWNQSVSILEILPVFIKDSILVQHISKSSLLHAKPGFRTNAEAFEYFAENVNVTTCNPETLLSLSLYFTFTDMSKAQKYLQLYQSNSKSKYKDYAKNLQNKSINNLQGEKKLVLYNDIQFYEKYRYGIVSNYHEARSQTVQTYKKAARKLSHIYPQYDFYVMDMLEQHNMPKADEYKDVVFSMLVNYTKNKTQHRVKASSVIYFDNADAYSIQEKKFEIFLYDPALWHFMYTNQYNEVQYISLDYVKNRFGFSSISIIEYPRYVVSYIIALPYLIAINNLPLNYMKSQSISFSTSDLKTNVYSGDLNRRLTKKSFVKVTRNSIQKKYK